MKINLEIIYVTTWAPNINIMDSTDSALGDTIYLHLIKIKKRAVTYLTYFYFFKKTSYIHLQKQNAYETYNLNSKHVNITSLLIVWLHYVTFVFKCFVCY